MSAAWLTIVALAVATAAIRAAGPVALGGRELPPRLLDLVGLLAPALLAALVVAQTLGTEAGSLRLDARFPAVAVAAGVLVRGGSMLWAVGGAAATAAVLRAVL